MIITKKYLIKHATTAGGYTRAQLSALGVNWGGQKKGWMKDLIGKELSDIEAAIFEAKQTAMEARGTARPSYAHLVETIEILEGRIETLNFLLDKCRAKQPNNPQWEIKPD